MLEKVFFSTSWPELSVQIFNTFNTELTSSCHTDLYEGNLTTKIAVDIPPQHLYHALAPLWTPKSFWRIDSPLCTKRLWQTSCRLPFCNLTFKPECRKSNKVLTINLQRTFRSMLVNSGLEMLRQLINLTIFRIASKTLFDLLSLLFPNQTIHFHFSNQTIPFHF